MPLLGLDIEILVFETQKKKVNPYRGMSPKRMMTTRRGRGKKHLVFSRMAMTDTITTGRVFKQNASKQDGCPHDPLPEVIRAREESALQKVMIDQEKDTRSRPDVIP